MARQHGCGSTPQHRRHHSLLYATTLIAVGSTILLPLVASLDCVLPDDFVVWEYDEARVAQYGTIITQNQSAAWVPARCTAHAAAIIPGRASNFSPSLGLDVSTVWLPALCPVMCLNGSSMLLPQREDIKYVSISAARLDDATFPTDTLSMLPSLEWIDAFGVGTPVLEENTFVANPLLRFVGLGSNFLSIIRAGTFNNNTALTYITLADNQITLVEPGAFRNTPLEVLSILGNHLTRFPTALHDVRATLVQIELSSNAISEISRADFVGLTLVRGLLMAENPVVRVEEGAFDGLSTLSRRPEDMERDIERVFLGFWSADTPTTVLSGTRSWTLAAIDVNAWPRQCVWVGPLMNDIQCANCTFGFVNQGDSCTFPQFGVREGYWNRSVLENSLGAIDTDGRRVIYVRNRVDLNPPDTVADPKRAFVGYSGNNYVGITYALEFIGDVNISCGGQEATVTGDTSNQEPVLLGQSTDIPFDLFRFFRWGVLDRPAYLQFEVTTAGNITFDSCDSLYATSLTVFRGWGPSAYSSHANLVGYDVIPTEMIDGWVRSQFSHLNWSRPETPWQGGCSSSNLARRKIYLEPGTYTLVVRGQLYTEDEGGIYVLKMQCEDGASTRPVNTNNPGGLLVDPITGRISGTPQRQGENYQMQLVAVEGTRNASAVVASWQFSVRERVFSISSSWANSTAYDESRGIAPLYHTQQLHTVTAPQLQRSALFTAPSNDDFAEIVFLMRVNGSACATDPRAFVNVLTGAAVFNVTCPGDYTATLSARDDAGFEVIVNEWAFQARVVDTSVAAYGPNGRGCLGGRAVDGEFMDRSFTCDCNDTAFSGDNCDQREETSERTTIVLIVIAVFLGLMAVLACVYTKYQRYVSDNKPEDVGGIQDMVLQNVGMAAGLVAPKGEVGIMLHYDGDVRDDDFESFKSDILGAIRNAPDLPPRSTALIKSRHTSVRLAPPYALITIARAGSQRSGAVEDLVAVLSARASTGKFCIRDGVTAVDVAVAVSKRVPAEIDRRRITRITVVGQGHFGEVAKSTIAPNGHHTVSQVVASKCLLATTPESRNALLREAALMALLEHSNLVQLVGVVTVPRSMPPLLLMEYCEHGNLLEVVRLGEEEDLDVSLLLTFCHDVACGLHYMGSRRIVHRDVSARNVLLDAGFVCKVSDFGMAAAISAKDDDYAANYVRFHGELPVRWSAIEVLTDNKYSRASDVWAYGVLVYEVMSRGRVPYAEFATLAEVFEQVKGGYQLKCPPECEQKVFDTVMRPCWSPDPSNRPGFGALAAALVDLGVVSDDPNNYQGRHAKDTSLGNNCAPRRGSHVEDSDEVWREGFLDRKLLGVSVYHICSVLCPLTLERVKPPWKDRRGELVGPKAATVRHSVQVVVDPATKTEVCPRDGQRGCAYVDTLTERDHVGSANALLSYTWAYRLVSVANALERWTKNFGRDPKRTYVWVCALCMNQHRMPGYKTPEHLANEFRPRVLAIGCLLPMLEPWDDALYLKRAWCLFELYTAIGQQDKVQIQVVLSEEEHSAFVEAMSLEAYTCIDRALGNIQSERATASQKEDIIAIRAFIESEPGGYKRLNNTVMQHLARWFEGQGAVRTPVRMINRPSMASRSSTLAESLTATRLAGIIAVERLRSTSNASSDSDIDNVFDWEGSPKVVRRGLSDGITSHPKQSTDASASSPRRTSHRTRRNRSYPAAIEPQQSDASSQRSPRGSSDDGTSMIGNPMAAVTHVGMAARPVAARSSEPSGVVNGMRSVAITPAADAPTHATASGPCDDLDAVDVRRLVSDEPGWHEVADHRRLPNGKESVV